MQRGFAFSKLADRLTSIAELSDDDLELLTRMSYTIGHFDSHDHVLRKGDQPSNCCLLLQGYLCWKDPTSGQITSIYVPGDVPDLHTVAASQLGAHLTALGPVVVAFVPRGFFHDISLQSESLARALRRLDMAETASLRNWIINLGSRDSLARVAHLICEITVRLWAVGLSHDHRLPSPFTQSDLAAACAISPVHANRVIQELRRRRALQWQSRMITISDWRMLVHLARFDPDYLGLRHVTELVRPEPAPPISPEDASALSVSS